MLTFYLIVFIKSEIDPQGNKIEVLIGDSIKYTLQSPQEKYCFSKIFNQLQSILTHGFYSIELTHHKQNISYSLFIQSNNNNPTEQFTTLDNFEITKDDHLDISDEAILENSNSHLDIIHSTLDQTLNFSEEHQEQEQSKNSHDISLDFQDQTKDFTEQSISEQFSNSPNFTSNDPSENNNNNILIISLCGLFFFLLIIIIILFILCCGCKKCEFRDQNSHDSFYLSSNDCSSNIKDINEDNINDLENIQENSQIEQCIKKDLEQEQIQQNNTEIDDNSDSSSTSYSSTTTKSSNKIPVTINFHECSIVTTESSVIPKI